MTDSKEPRIFDAVIVGGSYAGLSAAMPLVRARRQVLIIDAGQRRNATAHESHGFLTRDGESPARVAEIAREQFLVYPNASWCEDRVIKIDGTMGSFVLTTASGFRFQASVIVLALGVKDVLPDLPGLRDQASVIVLALGVKDVLPDLPGLRERWGDVVFTCPYCHGYELRQGSIGIIGTGPNSYHQAWMFPEWATTTLLLNNVLELEGDQRETLAQRSVTIVEGSVVAITGKADINMADGSTLPFDALAIAMPWQLDRELIDQIGCEITASPMGDSVWVEAMGATSVPGVFACGDCTHGQFAALAIAVGEGYAAGAAAHRQILMLGI